MREWQKVLEWTLTEVNVWEPELDIQSIISLKHSYERYVLLIA